MRLAIFVQFFIVLCSSLGIFCSASDASRNEVSVPNYSDLPRLDGRIVNGTKAAPGQFPHQVSLRRSYSESHFCGGSVIDDQWILTAAHCMFKRNDVKISPWSITVVAGQVRLNESTSYIQKHAVESIIVHRNFDSDTLTNDIALLKLKTPLNLNTIHVKAAGLETKMPQPGTVCKVSGWGYLAENKPFVSNDLMYVELPLIRPAHCRKLLVNVTNVPLGMFCAGYVEGLRDACQGDSGGGMICGDTLVGVVSGGEGCARPTLPGLYSDVPYYLNWILYNTNNYNLTNYNSSDKSSLNEEDKAENNSPNVYSTLSFYSLVVACTLLSFLGPTVSDRVENHFA